MDNDFFCERLEYQPWLYEDAGDAIRDRQRERQRYLSANAGGVFGEDVFVSHYARLYTDSLLLGNRSWIAAHVLASGNLCLGDDSSINPYVFIEGNVRIGNDVMVAPLCAIMGTNHTFSSLDVPIAEQPTTTAGIVVEDDVWLGAGVKIVDGVRVGAHSVLAAGAVVTRDVPAYSVVGGVPEEVIKTRGADKRPSREHRRQRGRCRALTESGYRSKRQ